MDSVQQPDSGKEPGPGASVPNPSGAGGGTAFEEALRPPRGRQGVLLSWGSLQPQTMTLLLAGLAFVLLTAGMTMLPVPYAVANPGPVSNTLGSHDGTALISISGKEVYPTEGALDLTTVRIYGGPGSDVTPLRMVTSWLDPSRTVVPEEALFPPEQTAAEVSEENRLEMVSSQEAATAAALRTLGYQVTEELKVAGFAADAVSKGALAQGDALLSVNGVKLADADSLRGQLQKVPPGQKAAIEVRRDGKQLTVSVPTAKSSTGTTVLGIFVGVSHQFPFQVKIQIENVGGSSAGMMFALGIIDKLTPGSLTKGATVAGTGTIDDDGEVGPIGFIHQKMVGARASGAKFFLAPSSNCNEVVGNIPDGLSVISVSTLAQARAALEQISAGKGEAGLARCAG